MGIRKWTKCVIRTFQRSFVNLKEDEIISNVSKLIWVTYSDLQKVVNKDVSQRKQSHIFRKLSRLRAIAWDTSGWRIDKCIVTLMEGCEILKGSVLIMRHLLNFKNSEWWPLIVLKPYVNSRKRNSKLPFRSERVPSGKRECTSWTSWVLSTLCETMFEFESTKGSIHRITHLRRGLV